MPKSKSGTPKTKKVRATKYTKLAAHCSKELNAKKKALVAAEKRLAKAQQSHQDLLSEVARLDMLDRCLRAVNEKTTPPQNIKYVYTYPYWVWNPGYVTYTVPNTVPNYTQPQWTFTNTPNLQGGSLLTNTQVGYNSQYQNGTITCTLNSGTVGVNNGTGVTLSTTGSGGIADVSNNVCLTGTNTGEAVTQTSGVFQTTTTYENGDVIVDLTTHAEFDEAKDPRDAQAEELEVVG